MARSASAHAPFLTALGIGVLAFAPLGCAHTSPSAPQAATPAAPTDAAPPCNLAKATDRIEYTCGGTRGVVLQLAGSAKAALDQYQVELEKALAGKGKVKGEPAKIEGLAANGRLLTISWRDKTKPPIEGYVFAFEAEEKKVVLVSCVADQGNETLAACKQALVDLEKSLPQATNAAGEPTLMGRVMPTPAGCTLQQKDGTSTLTCGDSSLSWWTFEGPLNPKALDEVATQIAGTLKVTRTESPGCSIMGQRAMCRRLTAEVSGHPLVSYYGITEHQGASVLVLCTWRGDVASLPGFCGQVFGAKAGR
jgi:hypothetical protein